MEPIQIDHWDRAEKAIHEIAMSVRSPLVKGLTPAERIWSKDERLKEQDFLVLFVCRELCGVMATAHNYPYMCDPFMVASNKRVYKNVVKSKTVKKLIELAIDAIAEASRIHHAQPGGAS